MLGNVFSPRWARARTVDPNAHALDFCAFNVALSHGTSSRWAMTEHPRTAVQRQRTHLHLGRNRLAWAADRLVVHVDERSAPWGRELRGTIALDPLLLGERSFELASEGNHTWCPYAPLARITVDFEEPRLRFRGTGYFDANAGDGPLDEAFTSWSWSRMSTGGEVAIGYDVVPRSASPRTHDIRFDKTGAHSAPRGHTTRLARTRFGLERHVRSEAKDGAALVRTLEDGPFYARTLVRGQVGGTPGLGVHESVSLDRWRARWVRFLLPFRMRVAGA